jgi:hypothetical protein
MARGDVKPTVARGYGGSWGGSGDYHYDDEGRGASKDIWEWFVENWEAAEYKEEWLYILGDARYYTLLRNSTFRYTLMDIAFHWEPGYRLPHDDTRAHRLVIKKQSEEAWLKFHKLLIEGYNRRKETLEKVQAERAVERDGKHAAYMAQREAEQAIVDRDDWAEIMSTVTPTVGLFTSEINNVFVPVNRIDADEGDYIDDVVNTYQNGTGWGYEDTKAVGTKLQVTVSLDLSNSMYYNGIHHVAAQTFRDVAIVLENMRAMYQDDLYTAYFTFSDDDYWGDLKGRRVKQYDTRPVAGENFGSFSHMAPSRMKDWYGTGPFEGTDTWVAPLLEAIENWEVEESDPGCMRLDIVITDAVLEHPKDIRDSDVIQERRDGSLQTVFLNFMPEEEWLNSTLPRRCFEVAVDENNISGILRQILAEFLAISI